MGTIEIREYKQCINLQFERKKWRICTLTKRF